MYKLNGVNLSVIGLNKVNGEPVSPRWAKMDLVQNDWVVQFKGLNQRIWRLDGAFPNHPDRKTQYKGMWDAIVEKAKEGMPMRLETPSGSFNVYVDGKVTVDDTVIINGRPMVSGPWKIVLAEHKKPNVQVVKGPTGAAPPSNIGDV